MLGPALGNVLPALLSLLRMYNHSHLKLEMAECSNASLEELMYERVVSYLGNGCYPPEGTRGPADDVNVFGCFNTTVLAW